jgi:hypothetical protein
MISTYEEPFLRKAKPAKFNFLTSDIFQGVGESQSRVDL